MLSQCKSCLNKKTKIKLYPDKYLHYDSAGKQWHGKLCPECRIKAQEARSRAYGIKARDDITEPMNKKGRNAERVAAKHFERFGFKVTMTASTGPDLILHFGDLALTCEVKSAIEKSIPGCYFVHPVSEKRKSDNFIAIVLPDGSVHVQTMESHLKLCPQSGMRAITSLIRKRRWVGAEECSDLDREIAKERTRLASWKHGRYAKK